MTRSVLAVRGLARLTPAELGALVATADALAVDPDWLATVIAFETGGSFDPAQRNHWAAADAQRRGVPYSGAVGLIQFMPATAKALGTTTETLASMTFTAQLEYVQRYLAAYAPRCKSLDDLYLAVFYPSAIGRADSYVMGRRGSSGFDGRVYDQNSGFDRNKDSQITKAEICQTIRAVRDAAGGARIALASEGEESDRPLDAPSDGAALIDLVPVARDADDAARRG